MNNTTNLASLDASLLTQVSGGLFGYPSAPCKSQYEAMQGAIHKSVRQDTDGKSLGAASRQLAYNVFHPFKAYADFNNRHPEANAAGDAWQACELGL